MLFREEAVTGELWGGSNLLSRFNRTVREAVAGVTHQTSNGTLQWAANDRLVTQIVCLGDVDDDIEAKPAGLKL